MIPWIKAWRMFWGAVGAACEQAAMASWDMEDLFDGLTDSPNSSRLPDHE